MKLPSIKTLVTLVLFSICFTTGVHAQIVIADGDPDVDDSPIGTLVTLSVVGAAVAGARLRLKRG